MKTSGDWLTLGILSALAAGAAARGSRAKSYLNREVLEEDRAVYAALFPSEEGIQDLNPVQIQGLKRNEILFPDGKKPDQVLVYDLSEIPAYSAKSKAIQIPTPRGPKGHQPKLFLREEGYSNTSLYSALLALWSEEEGEYKYFLLPSETVQNPPPVRWTRFGEP